MMQRFSSRRQRLDKDFLSPTLHGAKSYDRIAGYFSSSIIEVAGEALETVSGPIRIICNSDLQPEDVISLKMREMQLRREWTDQHPEEQYSKIPERLEKLHELISSKRIEVKVLPNEVFGLIHGKAGVVTKEDGSKVAFIGSMNESDGGWKRNYEILWSDESDESVDWVQEEFEALWAHPQAKPLTDFVVEDLKRISKRTVIYELEEFRKKENAHPASILFELPIYRQYAGLWEHQKYFVDRVFKEHVHSHGARLVLADMVGLGKTLQLAASAALMALYGDKPILVIAPKTLVWQWQEELLELLNLPTAVWTGKDWVDEQGVVYRSSSARDITRCPRRIGIISQGLITAQSEATQYLKNIKYECIIVDECHRARRKNLHPNRTNESPDPNNLYQYLLEIAPNTKSMLLATATPVQLYPIEAWDLLNILSQGNTYVLGNEFSKWRTNPETALNLTTGNANNLGEHELWDWFRNPFPTGDSKNLQMVKQRVHNSFTDEYNCVLDGGFLDISADEITKGMIRQQLSPEFFQTHNPFIQRIVRRTRDFLENKINPQTNEPYLPKIKAKLYGDGENEALTLSPHLEDAYGEAEAFSQALKQRVPSGGFIKTLLLRRLGSSIHAGKITATKMLKTWGVPNLEELDLEEDETISETDQEYSELKQLTDAERSHLTRFVNLLENHVDEDPKYELLRSILLEKNWLDKGAIVFSQYYDTIEWIAENLTNDPEFSTETIGLYAGGSRSGIYENGVFKRKDKEELKAAVKKREIRLLLGTDAASEGLNLQTLGTLINIDLPWNPTRLEQRKGRIQRIGQVFDEVYVYNMRYKGSVEDKVHKMLSERLQNIHTLFGQVPDVLKDVWINIALEEKERAKQLIDDVPESHPFKVKYEEKMPTVNWENHYEALDKHIYSDTVKKSWR